MGVIELLLLPLKGDRDAFLDLIRQVGKDFFFQAAQDKGTDHFLEIRHGILVFFFHDRHLKILLEMLVGIEKTGHQIVENAPEFA